MPGDMPDFRAKERLSAGKLTRMAEGLQGIRDMKGDGIIEVGRSGDMMNLRLNVDMLLPRIPKQRGLGVGFSGFAKVLAAYPSTAFPGSGEPYGPRMDNANAAGGIWTVVPAANYTQVLLLKLAKPVNVSADTRFVIPICDWPGGAMYANYLTSAAVPAGASGTFTCNVDFFGIVDEFEVSGPTCVTWDVYNAWTTYAIGRAKGQGGGGPMAVGGGGVIAGLEANGRLIPPFSGAYRGVNRRTITGVGIKLTSWTVAFGGATLTNFISTIVTSIDECVVIN